jgi:hypothetical protein
MDKKILPWWAYVMMLPPVAAGLYVIGGFIETIVEMGGG